MAFDLGDKVYLEEAVARTLHHPRDQAYFVVAVVPGRVGLALTPAGRSVGVFAESVVVQKKPAVSVYDHILDEEDT